MGKSWSLEASVSGLGPSEVIWGSSSIAGIGGLLRASDNLLAPAGGVISPLLCDSHTHGALGFPVSADENQMHSILDAFHAMGVGTVQLSTVTQDLESLRGVLETGRKVKSQRRDLIGIHLEGPFLSSEKRGAHNSALLKFGSRELVQSLIAPYLDVVSAITLDPLSAESGVIEWLVQSGVTVAVGHTMATYDEAREAFASGASVLTHAFNAMLPITSREPGPVMAAIDSGVTIELIADGNHVHPSNVNMLFREAPGRIALVSDSMPAAGLGDGSFQLGGFDVTVVDSIARTTNGAIAGSTLTLSQAVHNIVSWGVSASEALLAAVEVPRAAYSQPLPLLAPGEPADFLIWSDSMQPTHVVRGGVATPLS